MDITIFSTQVIAFTGMITGIAAVIVLIVNLVKKAKLPNETQNHRIEELEKRVDNHDAFFAKDLKRFESLEAGNRVIQKAMLALLTHVLDGDDIDSVKSAKSELSNFLINK